MRPAPPPCIAIKAGDDFSLMPSHATTSSFAAIVAEIFLLQEWLIQVF